jgi:hypothetical protein
LDTKRVRRGFRRRCRRASVSNRYIHASITQEDRQRSLLPYLKSYHQDQARFATLSRHPEECASRVRLRRLDFSLPLFRLVPTLLADILLWCIWPATVKIEYAKRLENGFPRIGHANPFADLAGDSDKMRQGRVAVVPHARGAVAVPGCRPGKWYETDAGRN